MSDQLSRLRQLLGAISDSPGSFLEDEVQSRLAALAREVTESGESVAPQILAESMAFAFVEAYPGPGWGTYYGPMYVGPNNQGQMVESPSIRALTPQTIEYWLSRVKEAAHPCLKLRYADLVWDFAEPVTGSKADYRIALEVIDETLETTRRRLYKHDVFTIKKLHRALSLAFALNNRPRIEAITDQTIKFEDLITEDQLLGTWGFSYDMLIASRKVPLTSNQLHHILSTLESRLEQFCSSATPGTREIDAAEAAALRLEKHYTAEQRTADAQRVLRAYSGLVVKASETLEPLVGHHWLQQLFALLSSRGMQADAAALGDVIRSIGERSVRNLKTFAVEVPISTKELEEYYSSFCTGSWEAALIRITSHFVPDPDHIVQQVKDLAQKAPLQGLFARTILDHSGRAIATIGSVDADLEGRVVNQTSQNLHIEEAFLRGVLVRIRQHYDLQPDQVLAFLRRSPIFEAESEAILRVGLTAYFREDHISSICVLLSQIEAAIRTLANLIGVSPYKGGRYGGLDLRPLGDLLRDEAIAGTLGPRVVGYLSVLLTDPRGWNLRNEVYHGNLPSSFFGPAQADRLIHVLLLLSMLREKNVQENG